MGSCRNFQFLHLLLWSKRCSEFVTMHFQPAIEKPPYTCIADDLQLRTPGLATVVITVINGKKLQTKERQNFYREQRRSTFFTAGIWHDLGHHKGTKYWLDLAYFINTLLIALSIYNHLIEPSDKLIGVCYIIFIYI